jgi:hypothetical protein
MQYTTLDGHDVDSAADPHDCIHSPIQVCVVYNGAKTSKVMKVERLSDALLRLIKLVECPGV